MPGAADRPPDLVEEIRKLKARLAELEGRALNRIAAGRQYASVAAEVSTSVATPVDLGGPSITVSVPAGAFVAVSLLAGLHTGGAGAAEVYLYEPIDLPSGQRLLGSGSTVYETMRAHPGSTIGATSATAGQVIFPATAGEHTYSLRYAQAGGGTGFFNNRNLWIEVF